MFAGLLGRSGAVLPILNAENDVPLHSKPSKASAYARFVCSDARWARVLPQHELRDNLIAKLVGPIKGRPNPARASSSG